MRVVESPATVLNGAMDHLAEVPAASAPPALTAAADAISSAGEVVAGLAQSDLVGSLTSLVENMSIMVKIGDEIAKVSLYLLSSDDSYHFFRSIHGRI